MSAARQQFRVGTGPRVGDWFQTRSGIHFYPLDPRTEDIRISDIAYALSHVCRYGGHVPFYSVAEHCVRASYMVAPEFAFEALLHDASEAYLGDMVKPFKDQMPQYRAVERKLEFVIALVYGLPFHMNLEVKHADRVALATERRDLFDTPFDVPETPLPRTFWQRVFRFFGWRGGWPAWYARRRFLARFKELGKASAGLPLSDQALLEIYS